MHKMHEPIHHTIRHYNAPTRAHWTAARQYESWVWTDVQEYVVQYETDQILAGYVPCRYRVPSVAETRSPDTLGLTVFLIFLFLLDKNMLLTLFSSLQGCSRPHQRPYPRTEGEEGHTTKEGSWKEGC